MIVYVLIAISLLGGLSAGILLSIVVEKMYERQRREKEKRLKCIALKIREQLKEMHDIKNY